MTASNLIIGWIAPLLLAMLPVWNWYVRRYLSTRADERAQGFINAARRAINPVVGSFSPESESPVLILVRRWHLASVMARPGYLMMAAVLLYLGASAVSAPLPPERSFRDSLDHLVDGIPSLSEFARAAFMLTYVALLLQAASIAGEIAIRSSSISDWKPPRRQVSHRDASTYWPAVFLLQQAARCGKLYQQYIDQGPVDLPRMSLRGVEKIVRRAWRTRQSALPPRWRQKELRDHAAEVIGALRFQEARQESNPGEALKNLTRMLVMIAERYAQGRTVELLDGRDLKSGDPKYDYPLIRLLVSGVLVLGALAVGVWAGVSDVMLIAAGAFAAAIVVAFVYRAPVPGRNFIMDLFTRP